MAVRGMLSTSSGTLLANMAVCVLPSNKMADREGVVYGISHPDLFSISMLVYDPVRKTVATPLGFRYA